MMLRSRLRRRPVGTLVAPLAALCALGLSASPALATGDRHRVKDTDGYLRPYPQSWFIGTPDCGPPRRLPLPDSSHAPSHQANGHLTFPYKTTCASTGLYGNYRNGRHLDHKSDLPPNTPVGWRWTTADGASAVIRYDAGNTWAFVPRSCIAPR